MRSARQAGAHSIVDACLFIVSALIDGCKCSVVVNAVMCVFTEFVKGVLNG